VKTEAFDWGVVLPQWEKMLRAAAHPGAAKIREAARTTA
jgi:hypothetical protein